MGSLGWGLNLKITYVTLLFHLKIMQNVFIASTFKVNFKKETLLQTNAYKIIQNVLCACFAMQIETVGPECWFPDEIRLQ
jgi:hypothetical protein